MIVPLDFLSGEHIPLNHWRGSPLLRDNCCLKLPDDTFCEQAPHASSASAKRGTDPPMSRIFDNIDRNFRPALAATLKLADSADFCVGYFNLRGWRSIDQHLDRGRVFGLHIEDQIRPARDDARLLFVSVQQRVRSRHRRGRVVRLPPVHSVGPRTAKNQFEFCMARQNQVIATAAGCVERSLNRNPEHVGIDRSADGGAC